MDYKLATTGSFNRLGRFDIVWRHTGSPAAANKVWFLNKGTYLGTANFVQFINGQFVDVIVSDTNWGIGGTRNYKTGRLLSVTSLLETSATLSWKYGNVQPVTIEKDGQALQSGVRPNWFSVALSPGERHEYAVSAPGQTVKDYIFAGNKAPATPRRGRVLILVDKTLSGLTISQFEQNLQMDGWEVTTSLVGERHDDTIYADPCNWGQNPARVSTNKAIIRDFWDDAPSDNNHVVLVGHIAIPYSGQRFDDTHGDHQGAWPADGYYADMVDDNPDPNARWTDTSVSVTNSVFPQNSNCPGDGRFDNDWLPSQVELCLGRIDFAKLPAFQRSGESLQDTEIRLLNQYLLKNSSYRHQNSPFPPVNKVYVDSNLGEFPGGSIFDQALRIATRSFGMDPEFIVKSDIFFPQDPRCLWGLLAGSGQGSQIVRYYDSGGAPVYQSAQDFADYSREPSVVFFMLHGSYFADFNLTDNNLARASLGTPTYGLATFAHSTGSDSGPNWYLEPLSLGDPIGSGLKRTVKILPSGLPNATGAPRWLALLGDPTLRAQITKPASTPTWMNGVLSWAASSEDLSGSDNVDYLVERSTSSGLNGPWEPGIFTQNTSLSNMPASSVYRIRTRKLLLREAARIIT